MSMPPPSSTFPVIIHGVQLDQFQSQLVCALKVYTEPKSIKWAVNNEDVSQVKEWIQQCILQQLNLPEKAYWNVFNDLPSVLENNDDQRYQELYQDVKARDSHWRRIARRAYQLFLASKGSASAEV